MSTGAEAAAAGRALRLEADFLQRDGERHPDRDAAIEAYVLMCRDCDAYPLGGPWTVLPDYYAVPDGTGAYELGFTLFCAREELGRVTTVYTDEASATVAIPTATIALDMPGMADARRRDDEVRRGAGPRP